MFWLFITFVVIGWTVFDWYMETEENWDSMWLGPIFSTVTSIIFVILSICCLCDITESKVDYEKAVYEKQQIELRGKLISEENGKEISSWVTNAQEFNKELLDEQLSIKYWGNMFDFHDIRFLDVKPIDIEGYIIDVPAYKVILEKK